MADPRVHNGSMLTLAPPGEASAVEPAGTEVLYVEAIRQALFEEMERDERVFVLGEDVGAYGGAFKVTEGLMARFGEKRVIDTPLAEEAIVGGAIGAAIRGLRPVAEMQFIDFISRAFDLITNFAAKNRYRTGIGVPMVIRGPSGGGVHGGPFHSQSPEMYFVKTPGLKVVAPATAYDAKGLLKAAIRDDDPVIYLEHKFLYRRVKDRIPAGDYVVPLGKAALRRRGGDLTIVTYGAMLWTALEGAAELAREGIEADILDLRTLLPLDEEAILESVARTSKCVILHEDTRTAGLGAEIAATISEKAFEYLDGPILRVTAPDTPVPYSPPLEEAFLPNTKTLLAAARKLATY
jgi:2-oxoisovalerate dehydrogenase E1 component beta subunit